jgi:uncharacterized spore protein YtfJ
MANQGTFINAINAKSTSVLKADEVRNKTVAVDLAQKLSNNAKFANLESNNYNNPLDAFRTYSTHFILTVSNSSEAFRAGIGNTDETPAIISKVGNTELGEPIKIGENKTAYLMLDSRRFSQYAITDFEFTTGFGANVDPSNPIFISSILTMKLTDNTGLSFFNMLMELSRNKLQSTTSSMYFLLNMIFVGHPDNGGDPVTVSTCNILMNLNRVGFELTSSGGTFELSFTEATGHSGAAADGVNINTDYMGNVKVLSSQGKSNTIGSLIDSLEDQLNIQSLEFYQKFTNNAGANGSKPDNKKVKYGKLVQYMITVPDNIRGLPVDTAVKASNKESTFLSKKPTSAATEETKAKVSIEQDSKQNEYSLISFGQTTTISAAILSILKTSKDFLKLSTDAEIKSENGKFVRTMITNTSDDVTHAIHFDIMFNDIPLVSKMDARGAQNNPVNVIKYDYIFTGHNSHILDFKLAYNPAAAISSIDMEVGIGKNRHATLAAAGQTKAAVAAENKGVNTTSESNTYVRQQDPVFFAISTKNAITSNVDQYTEGVSKEQAIEAFKYKQNFDKTYAKINFVGTLHAELAIRGNPNIIKKYADRAERNGIPPHSIIVTGAVVNSLINKGEKTAQDNFFKIVKPGLITAKQNYINSYLTPKIKAFADAVAKKNSDESLLNNIDVSMLPVFVKLNIKYPNTDFNGNYKIGQEMFTSDFFFNGYYQILKIRTTYNGGNFTHNMSIYPWEIDEDIFSQKDEKAK